MTSPADSTFRPNGWQRAKDLLITLVLWSYFTVGFLVGFGPLYLWFGLFSKDRAAAFQALNSRFYKIFFALCRRLIPRHTWQIDPAVKDIRGAVVLCNHVSYLDSILMVSLYARHTTIAKARLFHIPIFGRMITWSGYVPSSAAGRLADLLLTRIEAMPAFLAAGGNLFAFPEGTRSRDDRLGKLSKGVFKIARQCRAPIKVIRIENTQHLFPPGQFAFNTCQTNAIRVRLVGELDPEYDDPSFSITALTKHAGGLLRQEISTDR